MTDFAKAQAEATGGGRLGRLILLADITTLSPALLHICVKDLISNMISINEGAMLLRSLFTPDTIGQIAKAPGGDQIVKLIQDVNFNHDFFEKYGETVKEVIGHNSARGEAIDPQVAEVTRRWAFSAMILRDSVTALKQRLHLVVETSPQKDAPSPAGEQDQLESPI